MSKEYTARSHMAKAKDDWGQDAKQAIGSDSDTQPDDETVYSIDISSSSSSTVNRDRSANNTTKMHPLVAAIHHNHTHSALPNLPTAILIRIIHHLDDCSIECLRRVSRAFPHLVHQSRLPQLLPLPQDSAPPPDLEREPLVWPRFRTGPSFHAQLCRLLDRDVYCASCLAARAAPEWDARVQQLTRLLHCAKCDREHSACLFSPHQRRQPSDVRQCIGHEGFVRMCAHKGGEITWERLVGRMKLWQGENPPLNLHLTCASDSHVMRCEGLRHCKVDNALISVLPERPGDRCQCLIEYPRPTVVIWGKHKADISLRWTAHVPLGPREELTAAMLKERLSVLRKNAAQFICPVMNLRIPMPELRCLDPYRCDCVLFEGSEKVNWQFPDGRHKDRARYIRSLGGQEHALPPGPLLQPCKSSEKAVVYAKPQLAPNARSHGPMGGEKSRGVVRSLLTKLQKPRQASQADHDIEASHADNCIDTGVWNTPCKAPDYAHKALPGSRNDKENGPGNCYIKIHPCHSGSRCFTVTYERALDDACVPVDDAGHRKMGNNWYNSLDPESYHLTRDREGFSVYWCRDSQCRNYHGHHLGRFSKVLKFRSRYRKECHGLCQ